jgi:hypothetical protein
MSLWIGEEIQEMLRRTDGKLNVSRANLVGATNLVLNPAENKVKGDHRS